MLSFRPCAKCGAFYNSSDLKEENAVNIAVSYQLGFQWSSESSVFCSNCKNNRMHLPSILQEKKNP